MHVFRTCTEERIQMLQVLFSLYVQNEITLRHNLISPEQIASDFTQEIVSNKARIVAFFLVIHTWIEILLNMMLEYFSTQTHHLRGINIRCAQNMLLFLCGSYRVCGTLCPLQVLECCPLNMCIYRTYEISKRVFSLMLLEADSFHNDL